MKVHYRLVNEGIEIVRCFGTDSEITVPEEIDGRPVKRMSPYAFLSDTPGRQTLISLSMRRTLTGCSAVRKRFWQEMRWRR